jgi:hypothetical protein
MLLLMNALLRYQGFLEAIKILLAYFLTSSISKDSLVALIGELD